MKNKLAAGLATGGGGDGGVDVDALRNMFASKLPPESTIVRIEELEKMTQELIAKVMKHDKTLYQNSTLDDLKNDNSKAKVHDLLQDASAKDRAQSATKRARDSQASIHDKDDAATNASFLNLEKVFEEIDALNSTDNCLATRI